MALDFNNEYKKFYPSKDKPEIVTVPKATDIAVCGAGDPNEEAVACKAAFFVRDCASLN